MPSHLSTWPGPLILASRSPRRRAMLADAGIVAVPYPADLDDGTLHPPPGVSPRAWVMALAFYKARRVAWMLDHDPPANDRAVTILAADTVCAHDGRIIGQPPTADAARTILHAMRDDEHHTLTGVCLLPWRWNHAWSPSDGRILLTEAAVVRIGPLQTDLIEAYLAEDGWRGKAGGYNLSERLEAGWPIECDGDPTTVMGLPMRRLEPLLQAINSASKAE